MQHSTPFAYSQSGFSFLELLITVAIISVLAAVAYPAYSDYTARGKMADAVNDLSTLRLLMEQQYQASRTYLAASTCAVATPTNKYFTYSCSNATATSYTWTAKNKANVGLDTSDSYIFSIDQNGNQKTLAYAGSTVSMNCWKTSKSSGC